MSKNVLFLAFFLVLGLSACQKSEKLVSVDAPLDAQKVATLDEFIKAQLLTKGEFLWAWASEDMVNTALQASDGVLSVGYKPENITEFDAHVHEFDFEAATWKNTRAEVLALILASERKLDKNRTIENMTAYHVDLLPVLNVHVKNPETIALLRQSKLVRYAEPIGYEPFIAARVGDRSDSGCGSNYAQTLVAGTDYTVITPTSKQSWNHSYHNVSGAWTKSTGAGVKIAIIDTGASSNQDNLGTQFNQGSSTGRTIEKLVTLPQNTNWLGWPTGDPETPHDLCGHGTSMLGAALAPRGTDGAAAGIAYKANARSIRAAQDVFLDESREVTGVTNAYTGCATNSTVKIISMSMGRLTSASQISDAINLAYNNGKLMFCAAGTSFSWTAWFAGVIYPASMTQVVAITGVKTNLTDRCSSCHDGSKVDFVVVMERTSDEQHPLSLADSGNTPSTVGGSSVATASTAGMAAVIWSRFPTLTRAGVINKMKLSASNYPTRHSTFGWGRVNLNTATN